ncbi:deoxyribodipyrimidine photo-lyase [Alisedimentitalea sp. MJ-SS2]|uniref:cryptochrome/photolyase family protein n=1 Tax=Aliisedimentitalea sp. MJ-SS2 TaxID=3049795 RepID=UPI0029083C56|nr:deoxyribodipyrimidine photo-lyase [Alisedimentitalea sp. MJ-SS2]MDU8927025.1 deoxyribodipyrimidine photo-lyase [Alisedimentitalea sp. MJ-SS2]
MTKAKPIILWFRKDFRLADHAALTEAGKSGRPVIPVVLLDEAAETFGAAPKWRLLKAIECFDDRLKEIGSRLILRRGTAANELLALARETGAGDIWWTRTYDPDAIVRDTKVKSVLKDAGFGAKSWPGHVLFEPWTVKTKQGGFFKVYSSMWRAVRDLDVAPSYPAPARLLAPETWPASDRPQSWALGKGMERGAQVLARYTHVGESAANARLSSFLRRAIGDYKECRDYPAQDATSRLSENLAWGEVGPRTVWHAGLRAHLKGLGGAEHFLKELVWREFAYHLVFHTPEITHSNWRSEWDAFPWSNLEDEVVLRWKQGRTGVPLVDAAMREMYVTGHMHNRGRMIVGSYLTKHMLKHWRIGQKWFEACLIDWDPAANAMGWQWVAGSGPDAAPYFRIFNPETQAQKFDAEQTYIQRFVAELVTDPGPEALAFFDACPHAWGLSPDDPYPTPIVGLNEGRQRALAAYEAR